MDQKYVITRLVLGSGAVNEIGLSETEFNTLKAARIGLRQAHSVEEKFDIVMEDYVELETDLLCQTTRNVFFLAEQLGNSMTAFRFRLNRLLLHLLASGRMYLDQTCHDLSMLFGSSLEEVTHFHQARNHEYDTVFGYRVCEALRNFSQHQSLPIHQISYPLSRQEDGICNHTIELSLNVKEMERAGTLKATIAKEIVALGQEYIPLKPLVRDYVSSLGNIHRKVRDLLTPAIKTWEADSRKSVERFCVQFGNDILLLAIARIRLKKDGGENGVLESYYLNEKPSERRKQLERKNAQLNDVAAHQISSL